MTTAYLFWHRCERCERWNFDIARSHKPPTDRLDFILQSFNGMTMMRSSCKRQGGGGATWSGGIARDFICKPLPYFMWNTEDDYKLFSKKLPCYWENSKLNDQILGWLYGYRRKGTESIRAECGKLKAHNISVLGHSSCPHMNSKSE